MPSLSSKGVAYALRDAVGIDDMTVFVVEDFIQIVWKKNQPFYVSELYGGLERSQYKILEIDVDIEGTLNKEHGKVFLFSEPEGSKFYIQNSRVLYMYKDGDRVRLQGSVTSERNPNYIRVQQVLPPEIK